MAELERRAVHAAGAVVPALYLLEFVTWTHLRLVYLGGVALAAGLEAARLLAGVDWRIFRELTREYERTNPAGYALYVVGSAAAVLAFEPRIAVPAVLMLAIADPLSGLLSAGGLRGAKRPSVLAVTFAVSALIATPFVPPLPAALGALAATVADGIKPVIAGYVVDDNLTIPIGAAVAMWVGIEWLPAVA